MKKRIFKWTKSMVALVVFAMFFTSCETDASEIAQLGSMQSADLAVVAPANKPDPTQLCKCLWNDYPTEALSAEEVDALIFMREEEKLAHDVYVGMQQKWGANVFSNISNSEQHHMDAILCLINKYKLDDPVGSNAVGVFSNASLQELYNGLMAKGNTSLVAALKVGATIEDLDISDLLARTSKVDNKDISAVFAELTRASRNHLRAFNRNLTKQGETYAPQYIGQQLFDEIINSPKETGGNLCGTNCLGGGQGNCTGGGRGPGNGNCDGSGPNGNGPGNGGGGNGPGNGNGGRK